MLVRERAEVQEMSRPLGGPLDDRGPRKAARIAGEAVRTVRVGAPRRETARAAAEGAEALRERLRLRGTWPRRRTALPSRRELTRRGRLHLRGRRMQLGVVGRPWLPGRQRASLPSSAGTALRTLLVATSAAAASWTAVATFLVWWRGRVDEGDRPADVVVVLGAAQRDGVPSRVFAARLDHAVELMQRGAAPRLIVTGGADRPGGSSEADVARAYAVARGVPAEAILAETGGRSTLESLRNVALLMQEHGLGRAILVSDRTHMLRSLLIARRLGLQVAGSPTRTSPADRQLPARLRATRHEIAALAGLAIRAPRI